MAADLVVTLPLEIAVLLRSSPGRRQAQASEMDYIGDSQVRPTQPLHPVQESLVQTSVLVPPGTLLLPFLDLTCIVRSMSGIGHFRATIFAIIFLRKVYLTEP